MPFTDFKPFNRYFSYYPYYLPSHYSNYYPSWQDRYYKSLYYPNSPSVFGQFTQPTSELKATLKQTYQQVPEKKEKSSKLGLIPILIALFLIYWLCTTNSIGNAQESAYIFVDPSTFESFGL